MSSGPSWLVDGDMPKSDEVQLPESTMSPESPQTGFLLCNDWNWASAGPFPDGPSSGPFEGHLGSPVNPSISLPHHPDVPLPIRESARHERHGIQTAPAPTHTSPMFVPADDDSSFDFSSAATSFSDASYPCTMNNQSPAYPEHASFLQYGHSHAAHGSCLPSLENATAGYMSSMAPGMAHLHGTPSAHGTNAVNTASAGYNASETVRQFEMGPFDNGSIEKEFSTGDQNSFDASGDADGIDGEYYTEEEDDEEGEQQDGPDPNLTLIDGRPHFVPDMAIFENPAANGLDTNTRFGGIEEVHEYLRAKDTRPHDDTIPRTQDQKKAIVSAMVKLMKTTEYALDNENMIKPFKEGKHSHERMEAACWQVLETVIDRSLNGALLCAFNGFRRPREKYPTFADRMSYIFECLGFHKTICKRIMDPPYIFTLVDDPVAADKRVRSNKNLNARKGTYIVAGKEALVGDQQPPDDNPGPRKQPPRASKTKTGSYTAKTSKTRTQTTTAASQSTTTSQNQTATTATTNAQVSSTGAPAMNPQHNAFPVGPMNPLSMDGHVGVDSHMNSYVAQHTPAASNVDPYQHANAYQGQQGNVPFHGFQPMVSPPSPASTMRMQAEQTPAFPHQHPMDAQAFMTPNIPFAGTAYGPSPMLRGSPYSHLPGPIRRMTAPSHFPNSYPPPYVSDLGTQHRSRSSSDNPFIAQPPMAHNMAFSSPQFGGVGTPVTPFVQRQGPPVMQNGQKRSSPDAHGGRSSSPKRRR